MIMKKDDEGDKADNNDFIVKELRGVITTLCFVMSIVSMSQAELIHQTSFGKVKFTNIYG